MVASGGGTFVELSDRKGFRIGTGSKVTLHVRGVPLPEGNWKRFNGVRTSQPIEVVMIKGVGSQATK